MSSGIRAGIISCQRQIVRSRPETSPFERRGTPYSAQSEPAQPCSVQTFRSCPTSYVMPHLVQERCVRWE